MAFQFKIQKALLVYAYWDCQWKFFRNDTKLALELIVNISSYKFYRIYLLHIITDRVRSTTGR